MRIPQPLLCFAALLLAAALATPASAASPGEDLETIAVSLRDRALASTHAHDLLRSLTTEAGPRFAGTLGDRAGVAWAERTMQELGFDEVEAEPVTVPRWVRGEAAAAIVAPYPQRLLVTALGGSIGTPAEGITADVVEVPSLVGLDALPDDAVRGRIVFLDQRMERLQSGMGYVLVVPNRLYGAAKAAAKGAVAVVIRSVGTGTHRFPHTGMMQYEEGVPRIPAAALAIPDADLLERQLAAGGPVTLHLFLSARQLAETTSANVVGTLRGRERPEEIVLLGAHLDSWDLGTGAMDDGIGCVSVLEAARLIAELPHRPRRSIRVVLFANEEFGASGAAAYADRHQAELASHVVAAESDFGLGPIWRFATGFGPGTGATADRIAALLAPLGVTHYPDPAYGGTDLAPLRAAGVPVADLTGDGTYYFDYHHTADDTLDKVDPEPLSQNAAAYAVFAWWAAESDVDFGRFVPPPDEQLFAPPPEEPEEH
jgi:carboxypeptidase Q